MNTLKVVIDNFGWGGGGLKWRIIRAKKALHNTEIQTLLIRAIFDIPLLVYTFKCVYEGRQASKEATLFSMAS